MADVKRRLVLLYHGTNEARGGWFDLAHRAAVSKAASEAGHTLIEVEQPKLDQIDPDMPAGRLAADGKVDELPVMLRATFDRLLKLAVPTQPATAAGPAGKSSGTGMPSPWSELRVGSIVLASDSKEDGWFECVVMAVESSGLTLRLRWQDFPGYPYFTKPVTRVGLPPPSGLR